MTFTRYDLYGPNLDKISSTANELDLPHLANFVTSVDRVQALVADGTVRVYLRDLVRRGWFEIVSPSTGLILRSGSSLVLVPQGFHRVSVVYSFPEEPTTLLAVGDLGQGCPICAVILTARELFLGLVLTGWGFLEQDLAYLQNAIKATDWAPGPASGGLNLIVGHPNFAHHAWNQLASLEELARGDLRDGIRVVATHQPLGPIHEIFPELSGWPLLSTPIRELQNLNRPGALFAPVGSTKLTASLVKRLLTYAETRISMRCRAIRDEVSRAEGPVLWLSVRARNRTAINQHAMLTALGNMFFKAAPAGAIIIDGFSMTPDTADRSLYLEIIEEYRQWSAEELAAAEALHAALKGANPGKRIYVAAGLWVSDSILLSQLADIYFCHHGSVQHKIGWFSTVPGVVHSNRVILSNTQMAAWVGAQSEVGIPPLYLSPDVVEDVEAEFEVSNEFAYLREHRNYIVDIPTVVTAFLRYAQDMNVPIASIGDSMETLPDKSAAFRPKAGSRRSPGSRSIEQVMINLRTALRNLLSR